MPAFLSLINLIASIAWCVAAYGLIKMIRQLRAEHAKLLEEWQKLASQKIQLMSLIQTQGVQVEELIQALYTVEPDEPENEPGFEED